MPNYVVCLKWGTKYSAEYVNRLHSMVERNLTLPYSFVCFTDDTKGINSNIRCELLPDLPVNGWWYKPMFFDPNFVLKGTILFLDLDLIVFKNIDCLFEHRVGKFCIIRDFNRSKIKNYSRINSSVFRIEAGSNSSVYNEFIKNTKSISSRFHGDQEWIYHQSQGRFEYWPDSWIQSYKWEMRSGSEMVKDPQTGKRNFREQGEPVILDDTKIAVFHGDPNPKDCKDAWVVQNWR
jgi:hypothetical protein